MIFVLLEIFIFVASTVKLRCGVFTHTVHYVLQALFILHSVITTALLAVQVVEMRCSGSSESSAMGLNFGHISEDFLQFKNQAFLLA